MRVALRHFLLDREGAIYRLPSATFDRMLQTPNNYPLPTLGGQRVRTAEVAVEMISGRPTRILRSVFNILTFNSDGTLVSPLQDPHTRARAALALAVDEPLSRANVTEAGNQFVARGGRWKPTAALTRRIEQTALGRLKCPRISPSAPEIE